MLNVYRCQFCVGTRYRRSAVVLYSHHCCSCGSGLRGHSCLAGLVLGGLNLGLQVGRWVEVLALLAGAAALDVVHADGDRVVAGVDHGVVARVSKAAVGLAASAVAPLKLATNLGAGESGGCTNRHVGTHIHTNRHADVCKQKEKQRNTHRDILNHCIIQNY